MHLKTTLQVPGTQDDDSTLLDTLKTALLVFNGGVLASSLFLRSTAAAWSLIGFQQFIGYFAYINIAYPSHLDTFLQLFLSDYMDLLPNYFQRLTEIISEAWDSAVNPNDLLEEYQLPHKFKELETPTLFIVNAGSIFSSCLIVIILPCFLDCLRKFKYLRKLKALAAIHSSLRWNIPLRIFLESGAPLVFAVFIQIRKTTFTNIPYAISTTTAILALVYFCFMLLFLFKTLLRLKKRNFKNPNVENSVGTLYEGLRMNKYRAWRKYYYLIFLLRGILLVSVDAFLDSTPWLQVGSLIAFNVFFACYAGPLLSLSLDILHGQRRLKRY